MSFTQIVTGIQTAINNIGLGLFLILLIADVILWNIHPVLGTIGALFIFALLFGLITL